jgi:hypothetical protein
MLESCASSDSPVELIQLLTQNDAGHPCKKRRKKTKAIRQASSRPSEKGNLVPGLLSALAQTQPATIVSIQVKEHFDSGTKPVAALLYEVQSQPTNANTTQLKLLSLSIQILYQYK